MKESIKSFTEKSIDSFEGFLKNIFDSEKSKDGLSELFNKLRNLIGIKTKKELDDLKQDLAMKSNESVSKKKEENTLVFGDSIAVGLSVASRKYGSLYEKYVKSGASSSKVHEFLKKYTESLDGKSIVLMSGFNDLPNGRKGADKALNNMKNNIRLCKKKGGSPVLCSLYQTDYFRIKNEDIDYYNEELKKIAKSEGVKYVDLEATLKSQSMPDGWHLNTKGYGLAWSEIRKFI